MTYLLPTLNLQLETCNLQLKIKTVHFFIDIHVKII